MVLVIAWCRHHTAVLLLTLYAPVYIILDPAAVLLAGAANLLVYAVVSALLTLDRSMLPGMSRFSGLRGSGSVQQRDCTWLHTSRLASTSGEQIPLENAMVSCLGGSLELVDALALSMSLLDPRAAAAVAHPD